MTKVLHPKCYYWPQPWWPQHKMLGEKWRIEQSHQSSISSHHKQKMLRLRQKVWKVSDYVKYEACEVPSYLVTGWCVGFGWWAGFLEVSELCQTQETLTKLSHWVENHRLIRKSMRLPAMHKCGCKGGRFCIKIPWFFTWQEWENELLSRGKVFFCFVCSDNWT